MEHCRVQFPFTLIGEKPWHCAGQPPYYNHVETIVVFSISSMTQLQSLYYNHPILRSQDPNVITQIPLNCEFLRQHEQYIGVNPLFVKSKSTIFSGKSGRSHFSCSDSNFCVSLRPVFVVFLAQTQARSRHCQQIYQSKSRNSRGSDSGCTLETNPKISKWAINISEIQLQDGLFRKNGWMIHHLYSTGWWFRTWISFFHSVGNFIIPADCHVFQRGRYTTNQL